MLTLDKAARKRILTGLAAVLGTALMAFEAMPAQAAPPKHAPAWGYRKKQQQQNANHRRHRATAADIDGDGIPNRRDGDVDGDGVANSRDRDVDGDGIRNDRDRDDFSSSRWARDSRGNWSLRRPGATKVYYGAPPTGYYRDGSGRLVRRQGTRRVGDKDNDGIRNGRDRDIDGDGVRNWRDRDKDGDGVRNRRDGFDKNPHRKGTGRFGDKDGDGVRNRRDRDIDGDGTRNSRDRDKDGDRVRNRRDEFDKNPRRR